MPITEDFRLIKTEYFIFLNAWVTGETFIVGIADNELSVTEIANALSVSGPVDKNDHSNIDLAMKPVWLLEELGLFDSEQAGFGTIGRAIAQGSKVLKWTFSNPEGWVWFAFNPQSSALATGMGVGIVAKNFGVWVT